ncbi:MAG: tetratricopeptide repeat protein, partial [Desulfococcaceae bacterium]|nr:tetratricopeptide repeat protein [Desulfococcaceae bacterium]
SGVRSQESGLGTQDSESVPQSPAPDLSKALAHHQAGQLKAAQEIYQKIIAENPNNSNALHLSGLVSFQRGDYDTAVNLIQKAIDIFPGDPVYYTNLAAVFMSRQKYDHAIFCYENIIRLNPDNADVYINMGSVYKEKGEKEKALSFYQKAIERGPDNPGAYVNLGVMMKSLGRMDEAINCYNNALRLKPDYAEVYYNIGNVLREQGKLAESIHRYEDAIRFKPDYTQAYYNIGNTLRDLKKLQESIAYYQKALELDPGFADACNNMGLAFKEMKNADKAAACYRKALEIRPDYALACFNLGNVFKDQKEFRKSADCFEKALEIKPDYAEACSSLLHQLQHMCEWKRFAELSPGLDRLSDDLLARGKKAGETPFMNLVRHGDPQRNFQVAVSWADDIARNAAKLSISFSHEKYRTEKQGKIIIGYLSNDFRNHPVAHLIAGLFSAHKREDFEIHCYSYGPDDGSYYRKKIEGDCDRFFDIRELSTKDAVKLIYGNHVAILVDLMGYTGETNRLDICALRPAPVQVSFLGFPGTTGADFFDYLITDRIVTPPEHIPFCSESPVYMPHTYQVNDRSQKIAEKTWKRSDFALPENDFIFCSFNQSYKIEPLMFSTWMNILRQFPESVLWLLSGNDVAEKNLKKEAVLRGVHPDRIIFAPRMQKKEHLSRHSLAQLCLDTRIVNGHTTTSDALWAGVPMITLLGSHFASRVSASLLTAAGLPELVTKSLEEYENLALHLARNRDELSRLREKLAENRCKEPLFDTPLFARNLEKAYKEMWQIFKAGEKPRQIDVASLSDEKGKHSEQIFQSLKPEHHKAEPAPGQVKYVSPPRPSAELIKAVQHHQAGRLDQAEEMYRDILRAEPENPDVLHFLGVTAHQKGEHDTAAELMQRALVLFKGNPLYFSNLAAVFQAQGKPEQALASYQEALKVNPAYAEAYYGMAGILTNMERMDGAVLHFQKYLEIKPDNAGAYYGLGNAFYAKGDMENAVGNYEKALALKPDYAEVYNNLGVAYQGMEKSSSAMECYEKALALKPDYAEVYSNMGNLYKYENNAAKAMSAYEKALEMKPDYAEAYNNRGVLFQEQGNIAGALECFEKALALKPDYAEVHNNMGFALKQDDRIGEAVVSYKKALKIKPDYAEVWHNMGNAYQELNDADKAVSCYQKALELKPDYYEVYNNLVLQLQLLCDWPQLEKTAAKLDAVSRESLEKGEKTPELPFANLVRHADPVLNLSVAKSRSAGIAESVKNSRMTFSFEKRKKKKEGIVLGYFSNDFHDHATSHLILRLFEHHSREKFMINCYSYGRDDKSPYRKKIQQDCDRFADLREMSHEDAAKKIYDDGVDILIDLKGYTKGNRVAVCAFR